MSMTEKILLATDLDRTLLPNGVQQESPHARQLFKKICSRSEIILVYVSGRDQHLLLDAIQQYQIPVPDYAIADVGSSIYRITDSQWQLDKSWHQHIANDWQPYDHKQISQLLSSIEELTLQEDSKQNRFKLSFYLNLKINPQHIIQRIDTLLKQCQINANIIWSIDEPGQIGLIDILPQSANKLEAIYFLGRQLGIDKKRVLFAGDSGNDLSVLSSEIPAVLVANAENYVRQEAQQLASELHTQNQLYCAQGGLLNMNGHYAAGILEGLAHYFPEAKTWLEEASASLKTSSSA